MEGRTACFVDGVAVSSASAIVLAKQRVPVAGRFTSTPCASRPDIARRSLIDQMKRESS